ncbi:Gdp-Fucose Protein O-Fucosyltransferase 2 [Manis pentadactyla]|nr:Gdp-Fucose Protein O-Fucosyltransferase 2 [Manis pentadactyla]
MTLVGPLSTTEVEVSVFVGKAVVLLVKLGKVAISVVEVNIDIGMVALEVISLLGPISMHGVVGEVGTIITGIDSGHGTVEERTKYGVVLLIGTITEDVVGEVLEVSDKGIVKALTEDSVFSLLEFHGEVGEDLVVEVTTECTLEEERVEDSVRVDAEEEIMVTKEEILEVVTTGVICAVVGVGVVTKDVVAVVTVSVVGGLSEVDVVLVDVTVVSTPPVVAAVVEGGPMVVDVVYIVVGMGTRCDSVVEWRVCVLITDEVVLSVPVVLGLLVDVEEGPEEVTGMLVWTEGVGVLWEVVSVGVIVSVVAMVVMALDVVPVVCAVGEEGMVFAVVADILETMGVEVRLIVVVSGPVEGLGVVGVGVSAVVRVSVPTEDWVVVVMVSGVLDVRGVGVVVVVIVLPVE